MKTAMKSLYFIKSIEQKTQQEYRRTMMNKSLLSFLFFLGFAGNLMNLILPKTNLTLLATIGVVSCILFTVLLENKKYRLWGMILVLCWLILFCLILRADIFNGLRLCGNHFGDVLGQRFGRIYPIYSVTIEAKDYAFSLTLFFIPVCMFLSLLCSYLVKIRDSLFSLVLIAVVIVVNVFLEMAFSALWIGILVLAQVILFVRSFGTRNNFFRVFSKTDYAAIITASITIMCMAIFIMVLPSYKKSPFIKEKRDAIHYIDKLWYGIDPSLCLPDGDFINLQKFEPSRKTALEVTMEKPESLWLRGYVGSVYNGHGWSSDESKDLYKKTDLFYWLHRDNFYGQKQLVDAALVSGEELVNHAFGIGIHNVGASSRNIYAPYEFYFANANLMSANKIGDTTLNNYGFFGQREYEYVSLPNMVKRYPDIISGLYDKREQTASIKSFLHIEANYSEFIYDRYTQLPKDSKVWMDKYLTELAPQKVNVNFTSAKQAIITYLTQKTTYSTNPVKQSSNDFAFDFLTSNRTGYSVHYATAATLMFRYLGIPARYVEGYLITPKDVKAAKDNVVLKLDGTHAHAWTEVYLDGAGWIPVEVTPPYMGLMEEADSFEGVQGGSYDSDEGEIKEDDTYKVQDDSLALDETEGIKNKILPWMLIVISILLAALVSCFAYLKFKRKQAWVKIRLQACMDADNCIAVKGMFICAMEALTALGFTTEEVWLIHPLIAKMENFSNNLSTEFEKIFYTYEKAVYSSHGLCDEERIEMQRFMGRIRVLIQEKSTGFKGIKTRRWRKLFSKVAEGQESR